MSQPPFPAAPPPPPVPGLPLDPPRGPGPRRGSRVPRGSGPVSGKKLASIAGITAALLVLSVGIAIGAGQLFSGRDSNQGPESSTHGASGQQVAAGTDPLTVDYSAGPTERWSVTAGQLLPDSSGSSQPRISVTAASLTGEVNDQAVAVVWAEGTSGVVLGGVDARTGTVRWTEPLAGVDSARCWYLGGGAEAACETIRYRDGNEASAGASIVVVDAQTGAYRTASTQPIVTVVGIAQLDGDLVLVGSDDDCTPMATRGTLDDLDARWSGQADRTVCPDVHFWSSVGLNSRYVSSQISGISAVFDLATGEVMVSNLELSSEQSSSVGVAGSAGYLLTDGSTTTVWNGEGQSQTWEGSVWANLPCRDPEPGDADRLGVGTDLVDVSDLTVLSSLTDSTEGRDFVCGEAAITGMGWSGDSALTATSVVDGSTLWSAQVSGTDVSDVRGGALLASSWSSAAGYSMTDGSRLWSADLAGSQDGIEGYDVTATFVGEAWVFPRMTSVQGLAFASTGRSGSSGGSGSDGTAPADVTATPVTGYATACGSPPLFTPIAVTDTAEGLHVEFEVTAQCPAGDTLWGSGTQIIVTDSATGAVVASGAFDFSASPISIPPPAGAGGSSAPTRSVRLSFPVGTFWRASSEIDVTTILIDCVRGASERTEPPADGGGSDPSAQATATAAAPAESEDPEVAAEDALRWQADHDRDGIVRLQGTWVPQLSSKQPGLVADGKTWNNQDTYDEFLRLRLRYSEVRLMSTEDWGMFTVSGQFWVTVYGQGFTSAKKANAWCDRQGFDVEHCYAKYIDTSSIDPVQKSKQRKK